MASLFQAAATAVVVTTVAGDAAIEIDVDHFDEPLSSSPPPWLDLYISLNSPYPNAPVGAIRSM